MDLKTNTQTIIHQIIDQEFKENIEYKSINSYFEFFSASIILKNLNVSAEDVSSGVLGTGNDGGIDSIYLFINGELIPEDKTVNDIPKSTQIDFIIIQSKLQTSFNEDVFMKWKTTSDNLLDINSKENYSKRYLNEIIGQFSKFNKIILRNIRNVKDIRVHFHYATIGLVSELHPNVIAQSEELKKVVRNYYPSAIIDVEFWDAEKIFRAYQESPDIDLQLNVAETPMSLTIADNLCLVKLSDYFRFITDEKEVLRMNLFDANVRDYQGKNAVNSAISNTLSTPVEGEDFWWLNNGITIIVDDMTRVSNRNLMLRNPQIVNGLQSSREIYNYFNEQQDKIATDKRCVLVKIIVPSNEDSRDRIVFATNNQTNITQYALRVSEDIHKQIEYHFKSKDLYYDRRKNFYKNLNKKSHEIVSVSFLAQCLISIVLKKPDYARARPSSILSDDTIYNSLYSNSINVNAYYNAAKIGKVVKNTLHTKTDFTQTAINDILFYVIYTVVRVVSKQNDISKDNIASFNLKKFTEEIIIESANEIKELYEAKGSNSSIVKQSSFVSDVDKIIKTHINN